MKLDIKRNVGYREIKHNRDFLYNVGSGGTGYHVITQRLRTAGFILKINTTTLYIDPGIGALVTSLENDVQLEDIDIIFVSHDHLDHSSDVLGIIESVYSRTYYKKKPLLIASPCYLGIGKGCKRCLSDFHTSIIEKIITAEIGNKIALKDLSISITPALHHGKHTRGFVLNTQKLIIGYTSDSAYFEGFGEYYKNIDVLITHPILVKSTPEAKHRHASLEDIIEMINESNPKYVLLRHLGYEVLQYGIEKFIKDIEKNISNNTKVYYLLDRDAVIF